MKHTHLPSRPSLLSSPFSFGALRARARASGLLGLFILVLLSSSPARAEASSPALSVPVPSVAALEADVSSVDGIMRAFYAVVNVRPDEPRQWGRDRTLYSPWVKFVSTSMSANGTPNVEVWDHQQLVDASEPLVRRGFSEVEIHRSTRRYGPIVHVDSTYETVLQSDKGPQRSRGVNSIELYFDGKRWWIASVMWMSESPGHPIPPQYLP